MKNTKTRVLSTDLPDSPNDEKHLQSEEFTIDMPEVKDIPGQEHIHAAPLGELADTTISSSDEEGEGILDDLNEENVNPDDETNVSSEEKELLREAAEVTPGVTDEENLKLARLDERDEDGELLNEKTGLSGSDLDIPGSEDDDENEEIGEEDEENNAYSLGSEDEDDSISKQ
ncbi:MAG: hypothetical protein H7Y42_17645 [Chitinophagaceae bacterium]|nr:hypothetical protein [Chitinophagaceae bacterium]